MTTPRIKGYKFGPFVLDLEERELLKSGKRVYLQLKALDLLVVLIENRGHGVTKDELMTRIWGQDVFVDESNLPHHISTLRKTLGQPPDDQRFVETLPRRGYRWVAPVKEITDLGVAQRRKDAKSPKGGSIDSDDAGPDLHTDPSGFTMLEVIREYAVERLTASQEEEALQRRHAEFFCNLAEHGGSRLQGETLPATLDALEAEIGNRRAALQWSVDSGDAETGLRIAGPLRHFWYMRDHTSEARSWLKSLLSIDAGVTPLVRAKAMAGAAVLAEYQADFRLATALIDAAVHLVREIGDRCGMAELLKLKGGALTRQEDYCGALPLLEESLSAYQELGDTWHVAATLNDLCLVAIQSGDYRKSIAFCERSLTLFEELKDKRCIAMAANNMALLLIRMGRFEEARAYLERSLLLEQDLGHVPFIATSFDNFAALACGRRQFHHATLVLSLADAWRAETNSPRNQLDLPDYESAMAAARSALTPDDFRAAWEKGQAMTVEEGVAYVLDELC
jgi:DNA-binding winged helix-turn-helix (wHTH) protein/tetratricopeptide (TPR) repeat protein